MQVFFTTSVYGLQYFTTTFACNVQVFTTTFFYSSPVYGYSEIIATLSNVDFPAPDGASITTNSPFFIDNFCHEVVYHKHSKMNYNIM